MFLSEKECSSGCSFTGITEYFIVVLEGQTSSFVCWAFMDMDATLLPAGHFFSVDPEGSGRRDCVGHPQASSFDALVCRGAP